MSLWHYYKRKERALNKDNKKMNNAKLSRRAMLGSAGSIINAGLEK